MTEPDPTILTAEQEAALHVELLRPLLRNVLRSPAAFADWAAADPHAEPVPGVTVLRYPQLSYVEVLTEPSDGWMAATWITPSALAVARKSLRPEMLHPDYAETIGQNARHEVLSQWAFALRLSKLTDDQRTDPTFLRVTLGGPLRPTETDPVAFVREVLDIHAVNVRKYGNAPAHGDAAYDAAYRPALLIQRVAEAFPKHPEIALVTPTVRRIPRDTVRVVL